MGFTLGSAAVVFIGLACIVPIGGYLVYLGGHRKKFPVIVGVTMIAVAMGWSQGHHNVRSTDQLPVERITFEEATDKWLGQGMAKLDRSASLGHVEPIPIVVVATAGGGIRAAYWTATILGRLEDEAPGAHHQIFAISGVSGGIVGATVYQAGLARKKEALEDGDTYEALAQKSLSFDFLSVNTARGLFVDLWHLYIPFWISRDRGAGLELAFEAGFRKARGVNGETAMSRPFSELWGGRDSKFGWLPILFLNGTHQEQGNRVIQSNVQLNRKSRDLESEFYTDAYDFFDLNDHDIRASTAAHNSARFSYISPAGRMVCRGNSCPNKYTGHILDGGYFENFGALTALETIGGLITTLPQTVDNEAESGLYKDLRFKIVVIEIVSDASYVKDRLEHPHTNNNWFNEIWAPINGLMSVRGGHAVLADHQLRDWVDNWEEGCPKAGEASDDKSCDRNSIFAKPVLFQFKLENTDEKTGQQPPLGWVLSSEMEKDITNMLSKGNNACTFGNLLEYLGMPEEQIDSQYKCQSS